MEEQQLLNYLLDRAKNDHGLHRSHLMLLVAIHHRWQNNDYKNPVGITRRSLMLISKLKSFATYTKCMKDLEAFGYLKYKPSYNPKGSLVHWPDDFPVHLK